MSQTFRVQGMLVLRTDFMFKDPSEITEEQSHALVRYLGDGVDVHASVTVYDETGQQPLDGIPQNIVNGMMAALLSACQKTLTSYVANLGTETFSVPEDKENLS